MKFINLSLFFLLPYRCLICSDLIKNISLLYGSTISNFIWIYFHTPFSILSIPIQFFSHKFGATACPVKLRCSYITKNAGEFRLVGIKTHYITLTHRLEDTWLSLMGDDQHQKIGSLYSPLPRSILYLPPGLDEYRMHFYDNLFSFNFRTLTNLNC